MSNHTAGKWYAANWTSHAPRTVLVDDASALTGKRVIAECERDEDAAFIVYAVNSHDQWAKWIVQRGPGLPDHACAECLPHSDMLKPGFQCVYHEALSATGA